LCWVTTHCFRADTSQLVRWLGYGMDDRGVVVQCSVEVRDLPFLWIVQVASGNQPLPC
jgi:hypothetical protein